MAANEHWHATASYTQKKKYYDAQTVTKITDTNFTSTHFRSWETVRMCLNRTTPITTRPLSLRPFPRAPPFNPTFSRHPRLRRLYQTRFLRRLLRLITTTTTTSRQLYPRHHRPRQPTTVTRPSPLLPSATSPTSTLPSVSNVGLAPTRLLLLRWTGSRAMLHAHLHHSHSRKFSTWSVEAL